ncbi:MAG: TlpA disulfide reductase family protein [Acidobacteriota bacterium]
MRNSELLIGLVIMGISAQAQELAGVWDATVLANGSRVPFRFVIEGRQDNITGVFSNGRDSYRSTKGSFDGRKLEFEFDYYATKLEAVFEAGELKGQYGRAKRWYDFSARLAGTVPESPGAPEIGGEWEIETVSAKGEKAWRLIVLQKGGRADATVLRIDGDTGLLSGSFDGEKFLLGHFSGARPGLLEIRRGTEGTLNLRLNGKEYAARRPEAARAAGLTGPTDPHQFTGVKNASEPLRFSAPDLHGKLVKESDERFRGKVVLVNVMGSWCPNCHDVAPFLAELDRQYRSRGLEIVALDFEEAEQLADPARLRAFVKKHGIEYPVLLAGEISEAKEKLKQAENWNSWPTTFFVGRDGLVKGAHAGFPGVASGRLHEEAKREFTRKVEDLLEQRQLSERED